MLRYILEIMSVIVLGQHEKQEASLGYTQLDYANAFANVSMDGMVKSYFDRNGYEAVIDRLQTSFKTTFVAMNNWPLIGRLLFPGIDSWELAQHFQILELVKRVVNREVVIPTGAAIATGVSPRKKMELSDFLSSDEELIVPEICIVQEEESIALLARKPNETKDFLFLVTGK